MAAKKVQVGGSGRYWGRWSSIHQIQKPLTSRPLFACLELPNGFCLNRVQLMAFHSSLAHFGPSWLSQMESEDLRALTPLIYAHINPYGTFKLDLDQRLKLDAG